MIPKPILILPGYADSGPDHWQTHWERADPRCRRVVQDDWLQPRLDDWLATLGRHIRECATPPVLVAHSLACSLVAHWAMRVRADVEGRPGFAGAPRASGGLGGPLEAPHVQVKAALLVAPADVDSPGHTPDEVRGFSPIPLARLPFPSIVVASGDDPFVSPERAATFARAWGSRLATLERAGHINADAGFGPWPEGQGGCWLISRASRPLKKAHLLRWRPRPHAQRTGSTPRVRRSGAASHLDLFKRPARFSASCWTRDGDVPNGASS